MHTAGTWWIFQPKSSEQSTENAPVDISPPAVSQTLCTVQYFWIQFSPVLFSSTCRGGALKSISDTLLLTVLAVALFHNHKGTPKFKKGDPIFSKKGTFTT